MWILLEEGDEIREGDEDLDCYSEDWGPVSQADVGKRVGDTGLFRRKLSSHAVRALSEIGEI